MQSTGAARTSTSTVLSVGSVCSAGATVSGGAAGGTVCQTTTATSLVTTTIAGSNAAYTSYIPTTITSVSTAAAQTSSVCVTADQTTTTTSTTSSSTTTTTPPPSTSTSTTSSTTTTSSSSSSSSAAVATSTPATSAAAAPTTATSPSSSSASSSSSSGFQTITSYSTLLVTTTGADGATSIATTSSPIAGLQSGKGAAGAPSSHVSTGAIAGGVVGGVAGLALLAGVVLLLRRKGFFRKDADEHFTDDMWAPQAHSPGMAGFGAAGAATGVAAGAVAGAGVRSRVGHGDDEDEVADHSHNSAEGMVMSEKNFDRQASWYSGDQHAPLPTSNTGGGYYAQPTSSHGHSMYPSGDGLAAMGLAGVGAGAGAAAAHHQGVGSMSSGGHGPDGMYYGGGPSASGHPDYYGNAYPAYPPAARSPTPGNELNSSFARQPSFDRLNSGSPGPLALDEPGHHLGLDFSSGAIPAHAHSHAQNQDAYGGLSEDGFAGPSTAGATAMGSEEGHLSDLAHPELPFARPGNVRHHSADSFTGPSQFLGARVANGDEQ